MLIRHLLGLGGGPALPNLRRDDESTTSLLQRESRRLTSLDAGGISPTIATCIRRSHGLFTEKVRLTRHCRRCFRGCLGKKPSFAPSPSQTITRVNQNQRRVHGVLTRTQGLRRQTRVLEGRGSTRLRRRLPPLRFHLPRLGRLLSDH